VTNAKTQADIDLIFDAHAPGTEADRVAHQNVRDAYKDIARRMLVVLPDGREKALVLTKLEEASFFAHAAIARQ
jgi:hypothetical protein